MIITFWRHGGIDADTSLTHPSRTNNTLWAGGRWQPCFGNVSGMWGLNVEDMCRSGCGLRAAAGAISSEYGYFSRQASNAKDFKERNLLHVYVNEGYYRRKTTVYTRGWGGVGGTPDT